MCEPAVANIWKRAAEAEAGIDSGIVTGLVVQGGGMRGVYSMAVLWALEECGLGRAFDHVLGSSAGAINGAYLLSGQAKQGVTVYLDDISNRRFINPLRLRRIMDIDYLVDWVVKRHKPLDVKRVRDSRSTLHMILTDHASAEPVVVTNRQPEVDLVEAIRGTAALPILYNKVVRVAGRSCVDGGIADCIPVERAVSLGCTDILVVLTVPVTFRSPKPPLLVRMAGRILLRNWPEATRSVLLSGNARLNRSMDLLSQRSRLGDRVRISVICPTDAARMVSRTTRSRRRLLACALMGRDDARTAVGLDPVGGNPFDG